MQKQRGVSDGDLGPLGGFDVDLTLSDASVRYFGGDGYANQAPLYVTPRLAVGRRWARDHWLEPLVLSGRVVGGWEFTGSDPMFRGQRYASPSRLATATARTAGDVPARSIDGTARRLALWDSRIERVHPRLVALTSLGTTVWGGLRIVLPTSAESRSSGLLAAPSAALGVTRDVGPVTVDLSVRGVHYLLRTSSGGLRRLD